MGKSCQKSAGITNAMSIISLLFSILFILFLPGAFFIWANFKKFKVDLLGFMALSLAFSISFVGFLFLISCGIFRLPFTPLVVLIILLLWDISFLFILWRKKERLSFESLPFFYYLIFLIILLALIFPLAYYQNFLPAGDSQKAIFWAEDILKNHKIPQYSKALAFSRDPVDFYTPGLHLLTAAVFSFTNMYLEAASLISFFAYLAAILLLFSIAKIITKNNFAGLAALLFFAFNIRFLRYLQFPGYHYQNIVGEVILLLSIYLFLLYFLHKNKFYFLINIFVFIVLIFTHQFTAFMAFFIYLPFIFILLFSNKELISKITKLIKKRWRQINLVIGLILLIFLILFTLEKSASFIYALLAKFPHLFNLHPHLLPQLLSFSQYPRFLGINFAILAIVGFIFSLKRKSPLFLMIVTWTAVILLLSRGPNFYLDIPPVRALYYAIAPLSILAGWGALKIKGCLQNKKNWSAKILKISFLLYIFLFPLFSALQVYAGLDYTLRDNSALNQNQLEANKFLQDQKNNQAILIDDFNHRRSTWFILTDHLVYSRQANEIATKEKEKEQSDVRNYIYLQGISFEKIYAWSKSSLAVQLMKENNIGFVVGVKKSSSYAFMDSPYLEKVYENKEIIIFQPRANIDLQSLNPKDKFLLEPSTLSKDLGDQYDTFLHLPASVTATIASYQKKDKENYLVSPSYEIKLNFPILDYAQGFYDSNHDGVIDKNAVLLLKGNNLPDKLFTETGAEILVLETNEEGIKTYLVPKELIQLDDKGFFHLIIKNRERKEVSLDWVALGLDENFDINLVPVQNSF